MSLFAVARLPREILFGKGQRRALAAVVAKYGRRTLVCTDERFAATAAFAEAHASLKAAGLDVFVYDRVAPDVPVHSVGECVAQARGFRARRRDRPWRRKLPRHGEMRGVAAGPRRAAAGLLRRVQGAGSGSASDLSADHGGHRLGSDAGGGDLRSRAHTEGRHLQPAFDLRRRRLRPRSHDHLPAGSHGHRRRRRADPRHRGLYRGAARTGPDAATAARVRRQERLHRPFRLARHPPSRPQPGEGLGRTAPTKTRAPM